MNPVKLIRNNIITVDTLPNASDYKGQLVCAPRWPLLESAPATVVNGQRFRLAGGTYGIEYLGVGGSWVAQPSVTFGTWKSRQVISLNGPDNITIPTISSDLKNNNWQARICFADKNSTFGTNTRIGYFSAGGLSNLVILIDYLSYLSVQLRNDGMAVIAGGTIPINHSDGYPHKITLTKSGSNIVVSSDFGESVTIPTTLWNGTGFDSIILVDNGIEVRPLQICGFSSSLNGTELDTLPCEDGTGLTVRNTTTPSRPGTITDSSPTGVWVYSWVPL
jgi:hypothetical protein